MASGSVSRCPGIGGGVKSTGQCREEKTALIASWNKEISGRRKKCVCNCRMATWNIENEEGEKSIFRRYGLVTMADRSLDTPIIR